MKYSVKKEIWTLPNMLSLFRIMLIPLLAGTWIEAEYKMTVFLLILSGITDMADGKIARKYGLVSTVGKILDPIADKLTIGTALLFSVDRYYMIFPLLFLFSLKEMIIGMLGFFCMTKGVNIQSARWFGKISTVILYCTIILFLLSQGENMAIPAFFVWLSMLSVLLSLFLYVKTYLPLLKKKIKERKEIKA